MPHTHFYPEKQEALFISRPNLLYTGTLRDAPGWFNVAHTHAFAEILYIVQGSGEAVIDGQCYPVGAGDLVMINQRTPHEERADDGRLEMVFLAVESLHLEGLEAGCLIAPDVCPVLHTQKYRYKIEGYFLDLINETAKQVRFHQQMSANLTEALLILIFRVLFADHPEGVYTENECERVKEYIDRHYTTSLTLESLSETVYISKSHLSHLFKSQTGMSPIKYLITRRIAEASRLLMQTTLSVAQIAQRVGYEDPVYFSQVFKKTKGMSPQAYRHHIK